VLPVSEISLPLSVTLAAAAAGEDFDDAGVDELLLLQAAASRVSGTRAAAVHIKRILLATRDTPSLMHAVGVRYTTRTRRVR